MIDNIKRFFIGLCYVVGCYLVIIAVVIVYVYGKKIINKVASLLSSEYINIQSIMIIKKEFIKVWYSNSKKDCLVEDFNGELIYVGDNRDDLLNIDKELDKDEQNVFAVK